jgi:hypothetical protein
LNLAIAVLAVTGSFGFALGAGSANVGAVCFLA